MAGFDRQKLQAREISVDRDFVVYGDSYLAQPSKRLRKSRPKPRPLLLTPPQQQQHSQLRKVKCFSWQTLNSIFKGDCNFAVPLVVVVIGFFYLFPGSDRNISLRQICFEFGNRDFIEMEQGSRQHSICLADSKRIIKMLQGAPAPPLALVFLLFTENKCCRRCH